MIQIDPSSSPLLATPGGLKSQFDAVIKIMERLAPLRVSLCEFHYSAVHPGGWEIIFGRHRTRIRCRCFQDYTITVQQAEAPPTEWYPDWTQVRCEEVEWAERSPGPFVALEKILHERFDV